MTGSIKPLLRPFQGEFSKSPPLWLMRQAGRYLPEYRKVRETAGSFLNLCFNPEMASEVTLQPIRRFGFDGAIIFSDILTVPYGLGQKVEFLEGEGPRLEAIDLDQLTLEGFKSKLNPVYEAIGLTKSKLPPETTLIGFAGAPWTLATYMIEGHTSKNFQKTKQFAFKQPQQFQKLLDLLCDSIVLHLGFQIGAGCEVVQIFDSWAGVVPDTHFKSWVIEPTQKIVSALRVKYPHIPIIGFPKGVGGHGEAYFKTTGIHGMGCDYMQPLSYIRDHLQPLGVVQGTLDPYLLVAGGSEMKGAVSHILETLSQGPFIFNLGHGIVPETPPHHVEELVALIRRNA